jgi:hypothetical protein
VVLVAEPSRAAGIDNVTDQRMRRFGTTWTHAGYGFGRPNGRAENPKVPAQRSLRPFDREWELLLLQATFTPGKPLALAARFAGVYCAAERGARNVLNAMRARDCVNSIAATQHFLSDEIQDHMGRHQGDPRDHRLRR